jgi:NADH dehydrogenase FAD-containing subunit
MNTIIVLGGGIGGLSAAFELKNERGEDHEIILVSDQQYSPRLLGVRKLKGPIWFTAVAEPFRPLPTRRVLR